MSITCLLVSNVRLYVFSIVHPLSVYFTGKRLYLFLAHPCLYASLLIDMHVTSLNQLNNLIFHHAGLIDDP